jgi:transcriptional regulator with XRE-family HTH domain
MIEAIQVVHEGGQYLPPHIAKRFADQVPRAHLEASQIDVLEHISHGLTDREVAQALHISVSEVWERLRKTIDSLEFLDRARDETSQARKPTMADIARRAGVSMATVSRVLHNKGMHTEETRHLVMKVVREYNFQLNDTAATLAMMRAANSED